MKKTLISILSLIAISTSLFALSFEVPNAGETTSGSFKVAAIAGETQQGLLLKYGTDSSSATLISEITDSTITGEISLINSAWSIFDTVTTDTFYIYTVGRNSVDKPITLDASIDTFTIGDNNSAGFFDSLVQPTIQPTGLSASTSPSASWNITIPQINAISGTYSGEFFTIAWDGTNASTQDSAPAGTYTAEVTLSVTNQ